MTTVKKSFSLGVLFSIIINGGSAIIFTIIAIQFFSLDMYTSVSHRNLYEFVSYACVLYLLLQGLQFTLSKVSTIGGAVLDIITSLVPLFYLFYVWISIDISNETYIFMRNIMTMTVVVDLVIFTPASLKMLLFTDKNANSGN